MQAFLVTAGVQHDGEGCQPRDVPPDLKTAPLSLLTSPAFTAIVVEDSE